MGDLGLLLRIKYHDPEMPALTYVGGKNRSDWVDLYTAENVSLYAGQYALLSLGVSIQLPDGYEAIMAPRSSTFKRYGILQANSVGVIDESFCGDNDIWRMPVYATREVMIPKWSRVCQFRLIRHQPGLLFEEVETLGNTDRGGFGSTGV